MSMLGRVLCALVGHGWTPTGEGDTGMVVLRCRRCSRETVLSAETFEAEDWTERWARRELAEELWIDPREVDPRIQERRPQDRRPRL